MGTCSQCGGTVGNDVNYCGACGSEVAGSGAVQLIELEQPEGIEFEQPEGNARETPLATSGARNGLAIFAIAAVSAVVAYYLIVGSGGSVSPGAADNGRQGIADVESATAAILPPDAVIDPSAAVSQPGFGVGYDQHLALNRGGSVFLIDLETGVEVELALAEPAARAGLASAADQLAYLGQTNAFLVAVDGSTVLDLGTADAVIDAGAASSIWVGEQIEADRMSWREINSEGTILRSTITGIPLDFDQPDLRLGHQSRMLRLTQDEARPWRLFAQGTLVAVGKNDVVIAACDADFICERRWFDLQSGLDQGPLLADVAAGLLVEPIGVLSPRGRYVATGKELDEGAVLLSIATGSEVENDCRDAKTLRWSTNDALLACHAQGGVAIHELETGTRFLVDAFDEGEDAFTFVSK